MNFIVKRLLLILFILTILAANFLYFFEQKERLEEFSIDFIKTQLKESIESVKPTEMDYDFDNLKIQNKKETVYENIDSNSHSPFYSVLNQTLEKEIKNVEKNKLEEYRLMQIRLREEERLREKREKEDRERREWEAIPRPMIMVKGIIGNNNNYRIVLELNGNTKILNKDFNENGIKFDNLNRNERELTITYRERPFKYRY